ncbi:unnamed protein product [Ambrosiozyma monospora]|uniref:Unnamed protein product n=1 Tax=Ambrosiozyma monospora TaxID=43982 RepID=A0A9W6Z684_AMBMO|nr:unnamed protein product [Ambrosiozyma monospora]
MNLCYSSSFQESKTLADIEYELAAANDDNFSNFQPYSSGIADDSHIETAGSAAEFIDTELDQSTKIDDQPTASEEPVSEDATLPTLFEPISNFYDASGAPIIDFEGVDLFDIDLTNANNEDVDDDKDDEKTLVDEDDYADKSKTIVNEDKCAEKPDTPVEITKSENFSVLPSVSAEVETSNACGESNCVNNNDISNSVESCENKAQNDTPKIQETE